MSAEESAELLYGYLVEALSQDAGRRQRAESALREAEEHQDFFYSMVVIAAASEDQAERNVRWLAAIQAKNAVSRSWRRRSKPNVVTEEEREYVRGLLLERLGQDDTNIGTQLSVWISVIARIDFPKYWPSLITDLCKAIRSPDKSVMFHALVTLDMVLKQLASRRLLSDRKSLYQVAPEIFSLLHNHFSTHLEVLVRGQDVYQEKLDSFRVTERCMKSFRRIIVYGCEQLSDINTVPAVFAKLIEFPSVFLKGASGGTEVEVRLSLLAAKLVRHAQARHPVQFQNFLPAFLEVYYNAIVQFDSNIFSDRTCFHGAAFLRNSLACPAYDMTGMPLSNSAEERVKNMSMSTGTSPEGCRHIVQSFFTVDRIDKLIEAIISRVFVLNQRELDIWANDPEALVREEEVGEWGTENLRRESEELFKILLIKDKPRVVPMILRLTDSVPADNPLLLDACYRAVGRAVYDVQGAFDFEAWLGGRLGKVLQSECGSNLGERVIQARTAWLVGQFVEQMNREARQVVNPLLVNLMSTPHVDRVVALTAAKAVQTLVEDLGFHAGDFAPYLETSMLSCFRLVLAAESLETKRSILDTAISLVERFPSRYIIPLVDHFARALPELWEEGKTTSYQSAQNHADQSQNGVTLATGAENLLRTSIVVFLSTVIRKAGPASVNHENMRKVYMPLIEFAIDPSKDKGGSFMMEEGCELWAAVVASSTEYTEGLSHLFPRAAVILGVDFDNLREVFGVMEGYCLLGRNQFLQQHGEQMLIILKRALDSVKDRGCLAACEILDCLLQLFREQSIHFLADILRSCLSKTAEKNQGQVLIAAYVGLLARACLVSIAEVEQLVLQGSEAAAVELVDGIVENLDSFFKLPRRQMAVLALLGLGTRYVTSEEVQRRVPLMLNATVQVLAEEKRRAERTPGPGRDFQNVLARFGEAASEMEDHERPLAEDIVLPEVERKRSLREQDIVQQLDVRDACTGLLSTLKAHREDRYEEILRNTSPAVVQHLESLLKK